MLNIKITLHDYLIGKYFTLQLLRIFKRGNLSSNAANMFSPIIELSFRFK